MGFLPGGPVSILQINSQEKSHLGPHYKAQKTKKEQIWESIQPASLMAYLFVTSTNNICAVIYSLE